MDIPRNGVSLAEFEELKAENARLKARNANLYRDCVSFAKLIKASGKKDDKIEELQEEIINLKAQIESLKNPIEVSSFSDPEEVVYNPKVHYMDEETFEKLHGQLDEELAEDSTEVSKKEKKKAKKEKKRSEKKSVRAFFKAFVCILFIISLLVSVVSGVSYLFSTTYKDYSVAGYRFASVLNTSMSPAVSMDDVILINYRSFDGIELDSLVVTKRNTRSVARITGLSVAGNESIATVEDKSGTYEVGANEFIGSVVFKIPQLGRVVSYASAHSYNYFAIVASADLFLLAILLLIPSDKKKHPKLGKDFTVEDFTI